MIAAEDREMQILEETQWRAKADAHEAFLLPYVEAYRARRARSETHPVHDFLFTYYQTNRQKLLRWRPTLRMALQGESAEAFLEDDRYLKDEYGVRLDLRRIDQSATERIRWIQSLISAALGRPPRFKTAIFLRFRGLRPMLPAISPARGSGTPQTTAR